MCESQHNSSYSCDGGFAEYVIAAAPFVARLPAGVDFAPMAPILCADLRAGRFEGAAVLVPKPPVERREKADGGVASFE